MKKHKPSDYLAYVLVAFLILLALVINPGSTNPTSFVAAGQPVGSGIETPGYGGYTLGTWAQKFFKTSKSVFPEGACAQVAEELIYDQLNSYLVVTEDFTTHGPQRISTMMFGIRQDFIGAMEMVYGKDLIDREDSDIVLDIWVEAIVRLPKTTRTTQIEITLFGKKVGDTIVIKAGSVDTPIMKCNFDTANVTTLESCKIERSYTYD